MNPWVLGQMADQHLSELRADAAESNRGRRSRPAARRSRPAARFTWSVRLHWPARQAVGCEA